MSDHDPDQDSIEQFIRTLPASSQAEGLDRAQHGDEHTIHTLLHFTLGERHYAIPGEHIREVIQPDTITRLPGAPDYIRGVVVHRRSVIGVLELERWLELSTQTMADVQRLILVEHGDLIAGLCTDQFTKIMTISDHTMQEALDHYAPNQGQSPYILAVLELPEHDAPVLLLHITRLLDAAAIRH